MNSRISILLGLLLTTRPTSSLIVGLTVLIPSIHHGVEFTHSFMLCAPFLFAAMGGFSLNDYCDQEKDAINEPKRPIPSGLISSKAVIFFSAVLLSISLFLAFFISSNNLELILYILTISGVAFYNTFVQKFSSFKTIYTSIVCSIPLLFVIIVFKYSNLYLLLFIASLMFILGREILMDVKDVLGDKIVGFKTIPVIIGCNRSSKIGFAFQFIGVLFLLPLSIYNATIIKSLIWIVILINLLISCNIWWNASARSRKKVISRMRLVMICGLCYLL